MRTIAAAVDNAGHHGRPKMAPVSREHVNWLRVGRGCGRWRVGFPDVAGPGLLLVVMVVVVAIRGYVAARVETALDKICV